MSASIKVESLDYACLLGRPKKVLGASFWSQVFIVTTVLGDFDGPSPCHDISSNFSVAKLKDQVITHLRGIHIHWKVKSKIFLKNIVFGSIQLLAKKVKKKKHSTDLKYGLFKTQWLQWKKALIMWVFIMALFSCKPKKWTFFCNWKSCLFSAKIWLFCTLFTIKVDFFSPLKGTFSAFLWRKYLALFSC